MFWVMIVALAAIIAYMFMQKKQAQQQVIYQQPGNDGVLASLIDNADDIGNLINRFRS
jgi:hypothetical protein